MRSDARVVKDGIGLILILGNRKNDKSNTKLF